MACARIHEHRSARQRCWPLPPPPLPPLPACSGRLRCSPHSIHSGLDKNGYDKSKCKAQFDAYKQCKKEEVRGSATGALRDLC